MTTHVIPEVHSGKDPDFSRKIMIECSYLDIACIAANIAIALRHKENTGDAKEHAKTIANTLRKVLLEEFGEDKLPPSFSQPFFLD